MNIALITDENYIIPTGTAIASVLNANPDEEIDFYIITACLPEAAAALLESFIAPHKKRASVKIITLAKDAIADFPVREGDHVSLTAYYRIFLPLLLPESVDRILYLDGDILCTGNLVDFYHTPLTDFSCSVVRDEQNDAVHHFVRLSYSQKDGYFNSGVMLINLDWWRAHGVQQKCLDYIASNPDACLWHDQDALNHVLHGTVLWTDFRYNFMQGFYFDKNDMCIDSSYYSQIDAARENPCILHFSSAYKPWHKECNHPLKKHYRAFYKQYTGKKLPLTHKLKGKALLKWRIKKVLHRLHIKQYADFRRPLLLYSFMLY